MPNGHGARPTKTHMRGISAFNANEGDLMQGLVSRSWWRRLPMWREMDFGLFKHVNAGRWMVQDNIVMSHEGPFMVISGHGQGKVKGGGKRERKGVKMR